MSAKALLFVVAFGLFEFSLKADWPPAQPQPDRKATFVPEEATISGIHAALVAGDITCVDVVQAYLRRIDAYDDRGPALNALISINPAARETAKPGRAGVSRSLRSAGT